MGRTRKEANVTQSNFFIRGLNKSSETDQTASVNIRLKLIADTEVEMAMLAIASGLKWKAIVEA